MNRKPDDQDGPAASGGGARRSQEGWWVWLNIICSVLLLLGVLWYLDNVYRYRPWLPGVSADLAQTVVGGVGGWLLHPLVTAFRKKKLGAFLNPARLLDAETARFLAQKGVTVGLALAIAAVGVLTNWSPMLHLRYDADGERRDAVPVVLVDGRTQQFHGGTIPVFDLGEELPSIVVTGNHNLYRVPLSGDDMRRFGIGFHKQVPLNRYFLYENLHVTLSDTSDAVLAQFTVPYEGDQGLEERCAALEGASDDYVGCAELLRATLDGIGGNLIGRDTGSVAHRGRNYRYDYELDDGANLRIRVPPATSELAQYPGRALEILGAASEQNSLLSDLRDDLGNMSLTARERMFVHLFRTDGLDVHLRGTMVQQELALAFVRDVLSLGVGHVNDSVTASLIADIEIRSLGPSSPSRVFVPAIEALVALSRDKRDLRLDVLARVNAFLRRLGTGYNSAKPAMALVLTDMLDDEIDRDIADRVLDGLAMVYGTARGVGPVTDRISQIIAERRNDLTREDLLLGLDGLADRALEGGSRAVDLDDGGSPR